MRVRKKPRHEVITDKVNVISKSLPEKMIDELNITSVKQDRIIEATDNDIQMLQVKYEKEVLQLKKELAKITKLTKNEEKILNAIKSEKIIQNTTIPTIGRGLFMKKYNLRPKYLDKSIQGLLQKGLVRRTFINYSSTQKTSTWEILQEIITQWPASLL